MKRKQFLCLLLCAALVLTMLPVSAMASVANEDFDAFGAASPSFSNPLTVNGWQIGVYDSDGVADANSITVTDDGSYTGLAGSGDYALSVSSSSKNTKLYAQFKASGRFSLGSFVFDGEDGVSYTLVGYRDGKPVTNAYYGFPVGTQTTVDFLSHPVFHDIDEFRIYRQGTYTNGLVFCLDEICIAEHATVPIILSSDLEDGKRGTPYSQTLGAAGDTPMSWSTDGGSLPDGLTLSSDGVISGTPTKMGSFTFTAKALNSAGSDTKTLSITINHGDHFSLAPGGTYYFDLSAQDIPGSVTGTDTSLKWVPFTYAGTIYAYSRTSAGVSTDANVSVSERSLFVADNIVTHDVSWDELDDEDLIFGRGYNSGGVSYKLRSLSVGSDNNKQSGWALRGVPLSNEWDQIIAESKAYIRNDSSSYTWGQDTELGDSDYRMVRAFDVLKGYHSIWSNRGIGFRPALEILNPAALGTDGLKTVTFNMGGNGTIGSGTMTSATVVYTGKLTLPYISPANGFHYSGTGTGVLGWYDGTTFYPPETAHDFPTGTVLAPAYSGDTDPGFTPGCTIYFDLSAQDIPGTVNSALPDTSLKWVPFTYVGTLSAYSRTNQGVSTADNITISSRKLFLADYNVTTSVSWDNLKSKSLIFGKTYNRYNMDYKLRAPSVGSGYSSPNSPAANEWDKIYEKESGFIKNWSGSASWGQDSSSAASEGQSICVIRGNDGVRAVSAAYTSASASGFRPVLEILNPDGLKTVTFDMGGNGTLGNGLLTSATVVCSGTLTLPQITAGNGFTYTGSGSSTLGWYAGTTFYAPGAAPSLATGTILIPGYSGTTLAISTPSLPNGTVGMAYSQTLTATGEPFVWSIDSGDLPDGLTLSGSGVISGTPTVESTFNFTVKAENSVGSDTQELSITINPAPVAPSITTTSLPNGTVDKTYSQTLAADGDTPIIWSLESGSLPLPGGLTLSSGGVISGTPTAAGTFSFTVKAENSTGSDTQELSITINPAPVAPSITTTSLLGGTVGTVYSQTLAATGDAPITWSLESGSLLPGGLTLSSGGVISGTPTVAGTFSFTAKAENSTGSDTQELSIEISPSAPTGTAPTITTTSLIGGTVGTVYNQTLAATGDTPITWSLESGSLLPGGLTLSSGGVISGTPTAAGTFSFTLKAENSEGQDTQSLSIVISLPTPPPIITTNSLPNAIMLMEYNHDLSVISETPVTWDMVGPFPNNGLSFYDGTISGTPLTSGTFYFTVKATNSGGYVTKELSITILPSMPPIIITTVLSDGMVGTPYSEALIADGAMPITWTLESGSLPTGLTLSSGGSISGTPSTAGTFTFTLKVENSEGSGTKELRIVISSGGTGGSQGGPSYTRRTLTDVPTGLKVSGNDISASAKLVVSPLDLNTTGSDAVSARIREAIEKGQLITGYDIRLVGGFHGKITVSFPVGAEYNGRTVTILHFINGRMETYTAVVENGVASIRVSSLSPFVVLNTGVTVPAYEVTDPPKTGDASVQIGFAMLGMAAACMGVLIHTTKKSITLLPAISSLSMVALVAGMTVVHIRRYKKESAN